LDFSIQEKGCLLKGNIMQIYCEGNNGFIVNIPDDQIQEVEHAGTKYKELSPDSRNVSISNAEYIELPLKISLDSEYHRSELSGQDSFYMHFPKYNPCKLEVNDLDLSGIILSFKSRRIQHPLQGQYLYIKSASIKNGYLSVEKDTLVVQDDTRQPHTLIIPIREKDQLQERIFVIKEKLPIKTLYPEQEEKNNFGKEFCNNIRRGFC
jgi:hypothetical protein